MVSMQTKIAHGLLSDDSFVIDAFVQNRCYYFFCVMTQNTKSEYQIRIPNHNRKETTFNTTTTLLSFQAKESADRKQQSENSAYLVISLNVM